MGLQKNLEKYQVTLSVEIFSVFFLTFDFSLLLRLGAISSFDHRSVFGSNKLGTLQVYIDPQNHQGTLPDRNSLGGTLTFDVETFHSVKLLSLTTKLVVSNFRYCVTRTSEISDS